VSLGLLRFVRCERLRAANVHARCSSKGGACSATAEMLGLGAKRERLSKPPHVRARPIRHDLGSAATHSLTSQVRTVIQERQVMRRITRVIASPISGSATLAPAASAPALATTARLT
jgi:hypothetical protein